LLKKRIRMLRNGKGSPDGLRIEDYVKDAHYTVPFDLAEGFRRAGYAVIEGDAAPEPTETEPAVAAPEPEPAPAPPLPPPPPIEVSAPDKPSVSIAVPAAAAVPASAPAGKAPRRPRTLSGKQDRSLSSTEA
jgi:hypothetical protein